MPPMIDLTGRRFGRLTVLERNGVKDHHAAWLCKCDCGNLTTVSGRYLTHGNISSCGCYKKELLRNRSVSHDMSKSRLYKIWTGMFTRCYRDYHSKGYMNSYKWYGAKGVKVCKEWHSFEPFMKWALSHGYSDDLTIDRIDNNGNYEPSNCQWITMKEQVRKQDRTIKCIVDGKEYPMPLVAELSGVQRGTMYMRIKQNRPLFYGDEKERFLRSINKEN